MNNRKDVYAAMAPATYTRTLGGRVGRSPTTIVARKPPIALTSAVRRIRRTHRDGSKALLDAQLRLQTKTDPEVLEIYRGARMESKVRHVRTAAGVARYHAPIGTPIVGGHAVPSLPSAGGGRVRAGGNAKRSTSRLIGRRSGGASTRGVLGARGTFGGRSGGRRGLAKRAGRRLTGRGGGGFNGGGGGGAGGFGGGAGAIGGVLGALIGAGGQTPPAKAPPKAKKPKKAKAPTKPKKGKTGTTTGKGKGSTTQPADPSTDPTTPDPTTPSQEELDQAAQQLLLIPPERLGGVLHSLPYEVLGDLLSTIQDPQFMARAGTGAATGTPSGPRTGTSIGSKALAAGVGWLETKDPRAAHGDERCMACGVDFDATDVYDVLDGGKGVELVVCVPCASESKAGDSGIPGHLPAQLRRYWTTGKGKARWAASAHPYTSLVDGLRSEGVPARVIHGLAANLFRDVFGIFPANRPRALGGSTHGYAR